MLHSRTNIFRTLFEISKSVLFVELTKWSILCREVVHDLCNKGCSYDDKLPSNVLVSFCMH